MNRKERLEMGKQGKKLLRNIFLLLILSQIILGLAWMITNLGHPATFYDTQMYLLAAKNGSIDEYMGILYPLLLSVALGVERIFGLPFYTFVYIVQLCAAWGSATHFMGRLGSKYEEKSLNRKKAAFKGMAVLYFLTFPLLMQLHMAVLPYSLAMSVSVLLLSEGVYYLRGGVLRGRGLIQLCGLWLLGFLLLPEYSILLGIPVCVIFLGVAWKDPRQRMRLVAALLSTVLCFGVVSKTVQEPGSMGRMQKTVGAAMVLRFVRPYFVTHSFFWDERIMETFGEDELVLFAGYPEAVIYEFGPRLEEKFGREEADKLYWDMAATSLNLDTKLSIQNLASDFLSNLCPASSVQIQLYKSGTTANSWNYGRMQDVVPILSKYYVNISFVAWNIVLIAGILCFLWRVVQCLRLRAGNARREPKKTGVMENVMFVACILATSAWYTMTNSMQDYKMVMLNSFVWLLFGVKMLSTWGVFAESEKEKTEQEQIEE